MYAQYGNSRHNFFSEVRTGGVEVISLEVSPSIEVMQIYTLAEPKPSSCDQAVGAKVSSHSSGRVRYTSQAIQKYSCYSVMLQAGGYLISHVFYLAKAAELIFQDIKNKLQSNSVSKTILNCANLPNFYSQTVFYNFCAKKIKTTTKTFSDS